MTGKQRITNILSGRPVDRVGVSELMRPLCGHENILIGMALDPDWIRDMCDVYAGMDIRCLETNDLDVVKAELDAKLPEAMAGGGCILHTDHNVSTRVEYDTYRFFVQYGRELGTY